MSTDLVKSFASGPREFASSPLYQRLSSIVAADPDLLDIAAHGRAGQQPTNLLFAAVHFLLLGRDRPTALSAWYRSVGGERPADDPALPGVFADFCHDHRADLIELVSTHLVQTNVVKRSAALRVGLSAVAAELPDTPVTLLEIGASGGIHLAYDRYRCRLGDTVLGPADSPVRIDTEWRSTAPVPTAEVRVAERLGLDLHPVDLTDEASRRWLDALVWPENRPQAELLAAATRLAAERPRRIVAGDAIETLPDLDAELPTDRPLVVWHAATRAHVPVERRDAFDAAIDALAGRRPLRVLSLETPPDAEAWTARYGICYALMLRAGAGPSRRLAAVHGHVDWIEPLVTPWPGSTARR